MPIEPVCVTKTRLPMGSIGCLFLWPDGYKRALSVARAIKAKDASQKSLRPNDCSNS